MKVVDFDHSTKFLDAFNTALKKFNEISTKVIPAGMAIRFLKSATYDNFELLSAWATCETIQEKILLVQSQPMINILNTSWIMQRS